MIELVTESQVPVEAVLENSSATPLWGGDSVAIKRRLNFMSSTLAMDLDHFMFQGAPWNDTVTDISDVLTVLKSVITQAL